VDIEQSESSGRPDMLPWRSETLGRILLTAITRFGDRPVVGDGVTRWTYNELGIAIARIIAVYKKLGLRKGDGLAMAVGNRVEQVAAQYAAVLMGVRYTALHLLSSKETHDFILNDAEIVFLVVDPSQPVVSGRDFKANVPTLRQVLTLGPSDYGIDLLAQMAAADPLPLEDEANSEDVVWMYYTGGTTGRPKGVKLPHRSLVAVSTLQISEWDLPADPIRFLAATPISHASGTILPTIFLRGGYARLIAGFEVDRFCRVVAEERINFTFLVPTMIYVLLDSPYRNAWDLSSLETIVYGAAPMSPDRLKQAMDVFGRVFVQLYGQTEAPMCITALRKIDHDPAVPRRFGSAGLPCSSTQVKLFDSEMREVPIGQPGEICVRGAIVMAGYWKRPEANEAAFRGGWLHTGDVATRSVDGYLTIVDRTSDLIITGGFNVYPREVEDALLAHPLVSAAAVIGVADAKWGEAVTAYLVCRPGMAVDETSLKEHVRELRGPVWVPKKFFFVETLPLTPLGKVDRKLLKAHAVAAQ
jgi:fatty-acyl-CoA synthase